MKRLDRLRKLFGYLRQYRHELFDETFRTELERMYRNTGASKVPVAPDQLAMSILLQGYVGASDAEAVGFTVVELRWQMVLGCLGAVEPAFSQGAGATIGNNRVRVRNFVFDISPSDRNCQHRHESVHFVTRCRRATSSSFARFSISTANVFQNSRFRLLLFTP